MLEKLPPEAQQVIISVIGLLPTALLGRLIYHQREARQGRRRFWSRDLFWEIPTAALCAVIAGGIASYQGLDLFMTQALVGIVGYIGPRGLQVMIMKAVEKYGPKKQE